MKSLCDENTTKENQPDANIASKIFQECIEKSYNDGYNDGFRKGIELSISNLQELLKNSPRAVRFGTHEDIVVLEFSVRTYNCLARKGINTISKLISACQTDEILRVRNLGSAGVKEIYRILDEVGYHIEKPK